MPSPIVTVPADLWEKILDRLKWKDGQSELLTQAESVTVSDLNPEVEARRKKIIELACDMSWVDNDGRVEVDDDAQVSEGDDNGCYVSAWVWVDFSKTEFDRCCDECMEVMESEKDLHKVGDYIYCSECYDPESAKEDPDEN